MPLHVGALIDPGEQHETVPRLATADPSLPPMFTTGDALAAGMTHGQMQQRLRSGAWVRVARGMYRLATSPDGELDEHAMARIAHVQRAVAAVRRNPGTVIGLHSAALIHGLPLFDRPDPDVCLLVPPGRWTGRRSGVVFRRSSDGFGISKGQPATSPARTWIDVARQGSLADALSVGDAALRRGLVSAEELAVAVANLTTRRGSRRIPIVLKELSPLRETALESGSWAYFLRHGLPLPAMQVEVRNGAGRLVGRVDFLWEEARLIGECDGRLKYSGADVLYAEKRREDELRALGFGMVRWGWPDLALPYLADRIRALLQ